MAPRGEAGGGVVEGPVAGGLFGPARRRPPGDRGTPAAVTFRGLAWEVLIITAAVVAYFGVRGLTEGSDAVAVANAQRIVDFERSVHLYWEPEAQELIENSRPAMEVVNVVYMYGHWPVIAVAATWLYFRRRPSYFRTRDAFLISGGLGLLAFALFPVAPPRLADPEFVDTVTRYSRSYRVLQPPAFVNQYAAMPSLHFGWNLLIGLALVRESRAIVVRIFGGVLPVAMAFAVVLSANHFILDAIAGAGLALFGLLLSSMHPRAILAGLRGTSQRASSGEPAPPGGRLLLIAHRAGNELPTLRAAEEAGADLIEADVWSYRGAVEVRHLKTMGPVPLLWDRWKLAAGWTPRLTLPDVVRASVPATVLLLDLKGSDPLLPQMVAEAMAKAAPGRRYAVCSRNWDLLHEFRDHPDVSVFHSIGSRRQLAAAWPRLQRQDRHGVSIHRRLLSPLVVEALKEKAVAVIAWPVNDIQALGAVVACGIDGITTDSIDLLRGLRRAGDLAAPRDHPLKAE